MLIYEQIVDEIRTVLTAEIDPTSEDMKSLDKRYTDAINEVNERLRECGGLLDNGLRNEAIHRCEAEPTLLNVVAILDIAEFDIWADYAKQFECAGPPRLLTEIAEQLNDAYNEVASLADLLRNHRLHALLRSPLSTRLAGLRTLAQRDSGTPIWQDDVHSYEVVRHNQLRGEIESAFSSEDLPALARLEQEVRSDDWSQPPSIEIIEKATESHTVVRVKTARRQLERLVDELTDAYSGFDLTRGRLLRARWHAQAAIALDRADDPLAELVAPALEWLDEQDRREQEEAEHTATLAAVDQALDDWLPRQELERLFYKLQSSEREISPQLASRIAERFAALELTAKRRSRLIAMGSVAIITLVGAVIAWGIYAHSRKSLLEKHIANLQQHVDAERISEAEDYLSKLEEGAPQVFDSAEIQKLAGDTSRLRAEEEGRKTRLAQLLKNAKESGATWEGYGPARSFLTDVDELVKNDFERAEASQVRSGVEAKRQQMQKKYNDDFGADLTQYTSRCKDMDTSDLAALKQLEQEGELLAKRPRVSPVLIAQVTLLLQQLDTWRKAELHSRDESELLASIDRAIGDRLSFRRAMETYIEALPRKPLSTAFKRILEEEPKLWDGIQSWNAFIQAWEGRDYSSLSAVRAKELIAEAEEIFEQHPGFPAVANVQRIVDFITPMTKRVDDEGRSRHLDLIKKLDENIPPLHMILEFKDRQYQRYYFSPLTEPEEVADILLFHYYVDTGFENGSTKLGRVAPMNVKNAYRSGSVNKYEWTAPQTQFSKVALDRLGEFEQKKWENEFYTLIKELDQDYALKMAPQVRVQLVELLLRVGCAGSEPMSEAYKSHLDLLDATTLDDEPTWVDPKDVDGRRTSDSAEGLLKRLGFKTLKNPNPTNVGMTPFAVTQKIAALLNAMKEPELGDRYRWVGWLQRDARRKWTVSMRSDFTSDSAEFIVIYPGANDLPQVTRLGSLVNGELNVRSAPAQALIIGRSVYTVVP